MPEQDIFGIPGFGKSDAVLAQEQAELQALQNGDTSFLGQTQGFFGGVGDFIGDLFGGGSGSNTWSNLISQLFTPQGVIGGIGTIFDYLNAGDNQDALGDFAKRFDPYETATPNRGPMQQQLAQMMLNPNFDATQIPGWGGMTGVADIAADTAMRKMSQRGNFYSGGAPGILAKTYADHFVPFMENYREDLLQTSGANFDPNQAAGLEALLASMAAGQGGTSGIFDFLGKLLGGGAAGGSGSGGIEGLLKGLIPGLLDGSLGDIAQGPIGDLLRQIPGGTELMESLYNNFINPTNSFGPGNLDFKGPGVPNYPQGSPGGPGIPPTPPLSPLLPSSPTAPVPIPKPAIPGAGAAAQGSLTSAQPSALGSVKGPAVTNYGSGGAQTGLNAGGAVSSVGGALTSTGGALTGGIAAEGAYAGLPAAYAPGAGFAAAAIPFAAPLAILALSQIGAGPYASKEAAMHQLENTVTLTNSGNWREGTSRQKDEGLLSPKERSLARAWGTETGASNSSMTEFFSQGGKFSELSAAAQAAVEKELTDKYRASPAAIEALKGGGSAIYSKSQRGKPQQDAGTYTGTYHIKDASGNFVQSAQEMGYVQSVQKKSAENAFDPSATAVENRRRGYSPLGRKIGEGH